MITQEAFIKQVKRMLGTMQGDQRHQMLVRDYNQVTPYPRGYPVKLTDDWCDIFVTVMGDRAGMSHAIGRECSVKRHVDWFRHHGIWIGRATPRMGDIVTFDWNGDQWPDHIGIVTAVEKNMITTIEGNAAGAVRERQYSLNAGVIYGYARPNYLADPSNTLIQAILDGRWGNGDERIQRLERAGYNYAAVQDAVNAVIAHPPLFMIAKTAKRWATGEWLANWVKGQTFSVKQTRYNQGQREYLLMNGTVPLGWIKATDGQIKV